MCMYVCRRSYLAKTSFAERFDVFFLSRSTPIFSDVSGSFRHSRLGWYETRTLLVGNTYENGDGADSAVTTCRFCSVADERHNKRSVWRAGTRDDFAPNGLEPSQPYNAVSDAFRRTNNNFVCIARTRTNRVTSQVRSIAAATAVAATDWRTTCDRLLLVTRSTHGTMYST